MLSMRWLALAMVILGFSTASAAADGDPQKGAKLFKQCMACHLIGPGAIALVGPPLNGVVGRKAGSFPDYPYSSGLKDSGLTWDEATLTKWLHNPRSLVPQTRMTFAGLQKDQDVADVIAYLKTFDASGNPVPSP